MAAARQDARSGATLAAASMVAASAGIARKIGAGCRLEYGFESPTENTLKDQRVSGQFRRAARRSVDGFGG